jgi:hypothetical protein
VLEMVRTGIVAMRRGSKSSDAASAMEGTTQGSEDSSSANSGAANDDVSYSV